MGQSWSYSQHLIVPSSVSISPARHQRLLTRVYLPVDFASRSNWTALLAETRERTFSDSIAMNYILLIAVGCFSIGFASPLLPAIQLTDNYDDIFHARQRREAYNMIEDCITVTSKHGNFHYKAASNDMALGVTCGLYFITDPDKKIEITELDLSCDGGVLSIVDGWEMNGEYFPSPQDHHLPLDERIVSDCGNSRLKSHFISSQNAALVQYRVPKLGQGFAIRVRYVKNPNACNILVEGTSDIYTLTNRGRSVNCSVTTLFPASVSVISLDVGTSSPRHPSFHPTTGITHKCQEKGMADYLEIGGSFGLDTTNMMTADTVCGVSRDKKSSEETIACGTTTVRLVSSGRYHNVATISIRSAGEEDLLSSSFLCPA